MAQRSRVVLVTGATGAIGRAIAAGLAAIPHHDVIVAGRDGPRLERLVDELRAAAGHDRIRAERVDVSLRSSVGALGARFSGPLDVLVNDAAVAPRRRTTTAEGIELVLATNVLGYLWMTRALRPALARGEAPRVVNVASYWAGELALDDLEFTRRRYDNDVAYRQSKQANRMLTVAWAERLAPDGITVNACHPGDVASRLSHDLGFGGSDSPEQGARTPVWLANGPELAGVSGRYFEHGREVACRFGRDALAVAELARRCDAYG